MVGDLDPEEAIRSAESAFGGWSGSKSSIEPPPLGAIGATAQIVTHRQGATQAVIRLGCRLPALDAAETVRARVVCAELSQRIGSVRQDTGISYGIGAWVESLRGGSGVLHIGGAVDNGGLGTALRTIRSELTRLGTLKGSELDHGRWEVATRYNLGLATTTDWLSRALEAGVKGWSLESIDEIPQLLASPNADKILAALGGCSRSGVLSVVGDEKLAKAAIAEAWSPKGPEERKGRR
jgi:predicted Zn-dependent peptidase